LAKRLYLGDLEIRTDAAAGENTDTRFAGMTLLAAGDSITEKNSRAAKNWHDYLHDRLGVVIKNDGKSGTGIKRAYGGADGMYARANTWDSVYGAFDAVILMGNMNDIGASVPVNDYPLGAFGDSTINTHFGALKLLLERLISKYPAKPVLFLTSPPRFQYGNTANKGWGTDGDFENYNNAVVKMCGHYSVPCLDLYHNSGLRPWNTENNAAYFSCAENPAGDGIHPNAEGHRILGNRICAFVRQNL
jgi:lysophospholipase L1-like esterase